MAKLVKITQIGDSLGVILPPDVLDQLGVTAGDSVEITETLDGILISNADEEFKETIASMKRVMRDNYDVLRRLANS